MLYDRNVYIYVYIYVCVYIHTHVIEQGVLTAGQHDNVDARCTRRAHRGREAAD